MNTLRHICVALKLRAHTIESRFLSMNILRHACGQASVEYLVVGLVLMICIVALAAIWNFAAHGGLGALVVSSQSHAPSSAGGLADVFLF